MAIQSNLIVFLFFGLAGVLLLGLIIFLVIYFSRSPKETEKSQHTTPLSEIQPVESNEISDTKEMIREVQYTKLVTLGRLVSDDRFAVQFGDDWISDASQLSFVQRNRLEKNLQEVQNWLGMEAKKQPEKPYSAKEPVPIGVVSPITPSKGSEKHKRQLSIVEQVDEILQELLETSPLKEQNIRLTEMPNKGVTVWVGNEYYEGINAVPDESIKRIIRLAVKNWEEAAGE